MASISRAARRAAHGVVAAAIMVASLATAGSAAADVSSPYAPLGRPGPALDVPAAKLRAALSCSAGVATADREAVLLVPGTTLTPDVDFSWNYERAFDAQHRPWCAVTLPANAMGDIQVAGEYVVHAIRRVHALTGHKVQVVGHSQGGMLPRWALRFWPDTRSMVDDVIGMAPSNHGTIDAVGLCLPVTGCAPAIWQQRTGSDFLAALNSGTETFGGISYTNIFTQLDEVVVPNFDETGSSSLHGGAGAISNIAVQRICPLHVTDHLLIGTSDPVAYALVMDALRHAGPADPSRVSRSVCTRLLQPGVDPRTFPAKFLQLATVAANQVVLSPHVAHEPALAPYTRP